LSPASPANLTNGFAKTSKGIWPLITIERHVLAAWISGALA
jgi:hypothetical protein